MPATAVAAMVTLRMSISPLKFLVYAIANCRHSWRAGGSAKISLLDFLGLADLGRRTFHHHSALGQNISVIGDGERLMHILLHKEDRNAALLDLADDVEVLLDEERRQAERGLVDQQQFRRP